MRRKISTLALVLGVAVPMLSTNATAWAQTRRSRDAERRDSSDKPFSCSGTVRQGRWVYVRNLNGQVRVEQGTGDKVEITAVKHWRRGDPEDVKISVRQT